MLAETVAIAVGVVAILTAVYKFTRWILDLNHKARRDDEALARIAQWFPDEHPNGEESLPAQVKRLHGCVERMGSRLAEVEKALGVKPKVQKRGW